LFGDWVDVPSPAAAAAVPAQVHRLGLQQMVGCGHLLLTTGKTGSVKLWPETQLRCTASEAGEQIICCEHVDILQKLWWVRALGQQVNLLLVMPLYTSAIMCMHQAVLHQMTVPSNTCSFAVIR
jgi:hypothetical protein